MKRLFAILLFFSILVTITSCNFSSKIQETVTSPETITESLTEETVETVVGSQGNFYEYLGPVYVQAVEKGNLYIYSNGEFCKLTCKIEGPTPVLYTGYRYDIYLYAGDILVGETSHDFAAIEPQVVKYVLDSKVFFTTEPVYMLVD